jgi:HAD superfamily hydrolase (TIGR01509 family)
VTSLRLETVLFDLDGTLIDSNGAHAHAWMQALGENGVAVALDEVRRLIGMGGDKLLPAIAHVDEDSRLGRAIARRKKAIFDTLLPGLHPTPGAKPLLEYLRDQGVNMIIATSADDRELRPLLERAGIDHLIPERTSKDDAPKSKPDPDIVQAALARAHARPELSVLIGDTPYDIEAATRAGINAIALRCGGYWPDSTLRGALEIHDDPGALLAHWRMAA